MKCLNDEFPFPFLGGYNDNDFALIHLKKEVNFFQKAIMAVCLPEPGTCIGQYKNQWATLAGWGHNFHMLNGSQFPKTSRTSLKLVP